MGIRLPLNISGVTTIPSHANFISIAMTRDKGLEWLCNYYVNIYVKFNDSGWRDSCKASFIDWGTLDRNYTNIIKSYYVPRFLIHNLWDFISDALAHNYYINLRLDEYYIPCCDLFEKIHNCHNTLISGIDFATKKILISDFYSQKKYQTYEVDFIDVCKAYDNVDDSLIPTSPDYQFFRTEIQLIQLNESYYKFSLPHLIHLLYDYNNGKDSTGRFFNSSYLFENYDDNSKTTYIYGLNSINKIAELFCEKRIGIQNIELLCDRYKTMVIRIKFLQEKYSIDLSSELKEYQLLEHNSLLIRNLCLKFLLLDDPKITYKIIDGYDEICKKERIVLLMLIDKLNAIVS